MKAKLSLLAGLIILTSCGIADGNRNELAGQAENLWGNTIDLADYSTGVTIIQPFSPANCGYCLLDGRFVAKNYLARAEERGGGALHQCLFNPQLDVYAFLKHYRETDTTTLVFPPRLHRYHRNGFPFLTAFKDGRTIFSGAIGTYEESFLSLAGKLWPDSTPPTVLTGPLGMAGKFIHENKAGLSIVVIPDGEEQAMERWQSIAANRPFGFTLQAKFQNDLTAEDLALSLSFEGRTGDFDLSAFSNADGPLRFEDDTVFMGPFRFPAATTALRLCLPNPHNPQRHICLNLRTEVGRGAPSKNWLDFVVTGTRTDDDEREILLEGFFGKGPDNTWSWDDALVSKHPSLEEFCVGGVCPAPVAFAEDETRRSEGPPVPDSRETPAGHTWRLGSQACRFPDLALDGQDICWLTWEENGDILLAPVGAEADTGNSMVIEGTTADSYNPVIAWDGRLLWVAYVHENRGFYRLFGRYWDGRRLSPPIPISDNKLTDVITPALSGDGQGGLTAVWTEWRANNRYLMTRTIDKGVRQAVHEVAIAPSEIDYTNAWYASLATDRHGRVFGAWNQHYPATLGVCSGDLTEQATSVTAIYGSVNENENGGYPDITISDDGQRWVVWETFGWDVLGNEPQLILAARFDAEAGTWSRPESVSDPAISAFCQTPQIVALPDGKLCVVWSGRPALESAGSSFGNWSVFMSLRNDEIWSPPSLLSSAGETARAPRAALSTTGQLWLTWQTGTGDAMRVEVLRVRAQ